MELGQPSPVVDGRQLAAQPDLHPLPRRTEGRRHRVEGVLAGHVVVGMDLGGAPVGDPRRARRPRGPWAWRSSSWKTCSCRRRVAPWTRCPAISRHQRAASSLRWVRSLNSPPLKKRSLTYWTPRSTSGLSLGCLTRAGSVMNPRCWEYSRKPRVRLVVRQCCING